MFAHIATLVMIVFISIQLAIQTGYATHARLSIKNNKDAKSLLSASTWLGWAGFIAALLYFGAMILFAEDVVVEVRLLAASKVFFIAIVLDKLLIGILMGIAAQRIKSGSSYSSNKSAYQYALKGAYLGIISSIIIFLIYGGIIFYDHFYKKGPSGTSGNYKNMNTLQNTLQLASYVA